MAALLGRPSTRPGGRPNAPGLADSIALVAAEGRFVEVAHPMVRRGDSTVVDFAFDVTE
ncbi:hypothetical protein [Streptacidiphilus sp. PAMC 29251]